MTNTTLKDYNNYLRKIEKVKKTLIESKETAYEFKRRYHAMFEKANSLAEKKHVHELFNNELNQIAEQEQKNYITRLKLEVMENNRKALLYNAVLPVIIEILNRYNGKQYGEKTAEKMRNELKSATGCTFYIQKESYARDKISFAMLDSNGCCYGSDYVNICPKNYETKILENNTINGALSFDDFTSYDFKPFIDNESEHVKQIMKAFKDAETAREKAKNAIEKYNDLQVGKMAFLNHPAFLPHTIIN